ncbi:MAG TPA: SprT family zinc-dependent metalloprotease [Candidatus Woesebacteria bacterium]|nr:SprT family zinc-dependent metalloprotease [Candidatus Woesebacteria bacterium]
MNSDTFTVQTTKAKSRLSLKLGKTGEILVAAPRLTPHWLIEKFVKDNQQWIARARARQHRQSPLITNSAILLFGNKFHRSTQVIENQLPGYYVRGLELIYNPVNPNQPDKFAQTQLKRFLRTSASTYLGQRTAQLAEVMGEKYLSIGLREQSSRWGSCSSRGHLSFNWRLVHFPAAVIDYVIIHELAHLNQPNHSRQFWQLVAKYCPEYQQHRKTLKRHTL